MARAITMSLSYQRAVSFCQRAPQQKFQALPDGRLRLGQNVFECRGEDVASALPLLVDTRQEVFEADKIVLAIEGQAGIASLAAIIGHNYPGFSRLSTFRQAGLRVLSPTTKFWLTWDQEKTEELPLALLVLQGKILYDLQLVAGENEFFMAKDVEGRLAFTCCFTAGLNDVVSPEEQSTGIALYLLSPNPKEEGLKLNIQVFASMLGNFDAALS